MPAEMGWLKKISLLRQLLEKTGPLWPAPSTKLAGYAGGGPFSCLNCIHLRGRKDEDIFLDEDGKGRCDKPVMVMDSEVEKDDKGYPIVEMNYCCEWVDPKGLVHIQNKVEKE